MAIKTLSLAIFDPGLSIVRNVFDFRLSSLDNTRSSGAG